MDDENALSQIDFPAGETVKLKADGNFVSLPDTEKDLNPVEKVTINLHFLNLGDVYVEGIVIE